MITPSAGYDRGWMLMLGDLLALLLSVFVLIHAMSALPSASWDALRAGLAQHPRTVPAPLAPQVDTTAGEELGYILAMIEARRGDIALLEGAAIEADGAVLTLAFREQAFLKAEAAADPALRHDLGALAALLRPHDNSLAVMVLGRPWQDGLALADNVAQALIQAGYDRPVERRVQAAATPSLSLMISSRQAGAGR